MHWTAHVDGGPRRVNHAAVAHRDCVYSFGGYCSGDDYDTLRPIDLHILNTETLRWSCVAEPVLNSGQYQNAPYQRYGHTCVEYKGEAFIWGGRNDSSGASNVLHACNLSTLQWRRIEPQANTLIAPARDGHSACVIGDQMIVFGGFEEEFQRFSQETYAFDFRNLQWLELKTKGHLPPWRDFHTAQAIGQRMYIFGGRSDQMGQFHSNREVYHDTLQYLDMADMKWYTPTINVKHARHRPSGRRSHSCWEKDGRMYVFGGYSGREMSHYNTTYEFDPASSSWTACNVSGAAPSPRRRQCTVRVKDKVYLFGGTCPSTVINQRLAFAALPGAGQERTLIDLCDLHVLDYDASLSTLCTMAIIESNQLDMAKRVLPNLVSKKIDSFTMPNKITTPQREENSG